ncbi:MAG: NAD(P)/FAD-dependent oxidoreductase [Proteobacteria bacterium]|nr:FAD-dependent oxidoreductase [Desulfobacula sp.]MBU3952771.1 NAD(P)/FAD-dependent oxidoreductase [Pseudomonadota bacterium]MBU4131439.1 NAD(P)/FAD-dependent oxidoreductase [Pseudomonadota bacterium]
MLSHLFNPIQIGNMTVKNRLMMSAMSINFGVDGNCHVTDQLIEYFVERAKGEVGMMLVGGGSVHPGGQELPDLPQMYDDSCIPSLKRMVDRVKKYDTRFGVQLMHGGRQSYLPQKVAPSAIPAPAVVKGEVRALEIAEIKELVACFGDAARRCRTAGFDFIEIHGAHGYLINQFMAPNSNIRTDEYGGSFENRTRFLFEILGAVRDRAGKDFPVGIRINGRDYIENGWELKDTVRLAPLLEKAGVVYLHISGGVYGSTELTIPSMYTPQGCFVHLAEAVKKTVNIPVITVGRIKDPEHANGILGEGKADMISMGRSFLADPQYPRKAREGKFSQIRPCVGCCLGCIHAVLAKEPGSCVVNPDVGREYKLKEAQDTKVPLKILVVGAGPAGMAAARMFALHGHKTLVCEKESVLGGLLALAAIAPGRGELEDILKFFRKEMDRLKVEIRYDTPLSAALLDEIRPDKVILATGSLPDMPVIKGLFQTKMAVITNVDLLRKKEKPGNKVVVLGGGMTGLIVADFLADQGKQVVVLNRKKSFAEEMSSNDRYYLRERLKEGKVVLYKNVAIQAFTDDGAIFKSNGKPHTLTGFDTVVISEKQQSIRDAKQLEKNTPAEFYFIGDARSPRHLMYCISEAEEIARSV